MCHGKHSAQNLTWHKKSTAGLCSFSAASSSAWEKVLPASFFKSTTLTARTSRLKGWLALLNAGHERFNSAQQHTSGHTNSKMNCSSKYTGMQQFLADRQGLEPNL